MWEIVFLLAGGQGLGGAFFERFCSRVQSIHTAFWFLAVLGAKCVKGSPGGCLGKEFVVVLV